MTTPQTERDKYQRMWTEVQSYRGNSPGEGLVRKFLSEAKWQPGESLIDLGSGPGRASVALNDAGLIVTMFDITETATDRLVRKRNLPFIEGCLWEMLQLSFDWAYCCDVLEHLPTEYVDKALDNIAAIATKGAFLQIALFKDGYGARINDVLHLTVMPAPWWMEKIRKRWPVVFEDAHIDRLIVLTGAPGKDRK